MVSNSQKLVPNKDLRLTIAEMVYKSGEGHIPSSFSILEIIETIYGRVLRIGPEGAKSPSRDYFVLSKGHGAAALYVVLRKYGFLSSDDIHAYGSCDGILGGHPDATRVTGAEFSTGSLGHGLPMAVGVALGTKVKGLTNQVYVLVGDGECHEGTVWESANIATNNGLDNLTVIVDWNGSASQLMPIDNLPAKWEAFGWETLVVDGHNPDDIELALCSPRATGKPRAIVAQTIKGFGVSFIEGHGPWHHRVPSDDEIAAIRRELAH